VYGDQPIEYDPFDAGADWVPPYAASSGPSRQRVPSSAEVRAAAEARAASRHAALLDGPLANEESGARLLPGVTEEEVLYGRILGYDLYRGGVKETLARRAEAAQDSAGGGAASQAAASLTGNAAAGAAAGEALVLAQAAGEVSEAAAAAAAAAAGAAGGDSSFALAGLSSSSGGGGVGSVVAAQQRWPWPTEAEVAAEAAARRAAPRVWVLLGGDGPGRQAALRSGANMVAKLQRCCDLQVRAGCARSCVRCMRCSQCWASGQPWTSPPTHSHNHPAHPHAHACNNPTKVDAFLMPPAGCGLDEASRRATLLARRTEWQALGIPEDVYPPSMSDAALL
jgi:hypothetical protein